MENKLAKKLKDAGFPYKKIDDCCGNEIDGHCSGVCSGMICIREKCDLFVIHPTLSELIEACGDRFVLSKFEDDELWYVSDDIDHYAEFEGKTPEEAVANFWLKLNKKYGK